jgi:hypothetical protein
VSAWLLERLFEWLLLTSALLTAFVVLYVFVRSLQPDPPAPSEWDEMRSCGWVLATVVYGPEAEPDEGWRAGERLEFRGGPFAKFVRKLRVAIDPVNGVLDLMEPGVIRRGRFRLEGDTLLLSLGRPNENRRPGHAETPELGDTLLAFRKDRRSLADGR